MSNEFYQYYLRELTQLERDFQSFASEHPQTAGNLGFGSEGATDPHVRTLVESVAFIAARLKHRIDLIPREIAYGMLHSLAPQLTQSLPSMSVARFDLLSPSSKAVGSTLPDTLRMSAHSPAGECFFSANAFNTPLWPFRCDSFCLSEISSEDDRFVKGANVSTDFAIRLEHIERSIAPGEPSELSFFISGALHRALAAIDALARGVERLRMVALDGTWSKELNLKDIKIVGFNAEDRMAPLMTAGAEVTALVQEYVIFPRRFCFFRVCGLVRPSVSRGFMLVFSMKTEALASMRAVQHQVLLNCIPVINKFVRPPVALHIDAPRDDYPIPRDDNQRGAWDVFRINRVRLASGANEREVAEFQGGEYQPTASTDTFWQGLRVPRASSNTGNAGLSLRFANLDLMKVGNPVLALIDMECTNCHAPEELRAGQVLELRGWQGGYSATLEMVPTPYVRPLYSSDQCVLELLQVLQWRASGIGGVTEQIRRSLALIGRGAPDRSNALADAVRAVDRSVVAIQWPNLKGAGGLGVGCQYKLDLRGSREAVGSPYIFARVLKHILTQIHEMPMPSEVVMRSDEGSGFDVV